jgi:hypothetical protein
MVFRSSYFIFGALCAAAAALTAGSAHGPASSKRAAQPTAGTVRAAYARLPLSFERNDGQAAAGVDFLARGRGYTLLVSPTEAALALPGRSPDPAGRDRPQRRIGGLAGGADSGKTQARSGACGWWARTRGQRLPATARSRGS